MCHVKDNCFIHSLFSIFHTKLFLKLQVFRVKVFSEIHKLSIIFGDTDVTNLSTIPFKTRVFNVFQHLAICYTLINPHSVRCLRTVLLCTHVGLATMTSSHLTGFIITLSSATSYSTLGLKVNRSSG